ncbi:MAG: dockerin type I domain-containing protein, partial [Rubripirellula sp.]|nr:dockerin type I domain-containing protein [Rubripirellula sp.]
VTVPSLAAQANHRSSVSIVLPASAPTELTSAGTVYIKMVSDHAMSIEEANENNNMHLGLGVDAVAVDVTQDDFFTVLTHGFNPNPFSYAAINHSWDVTYPSAVNDYAQSLGLDDASEVHSELWASSEGWMDAIVNAVATLTAQSMAVAQPQYAFLWNRIRNYAFGRIGPAMEVAERRAMEAGARIAEVVSAQYTSPDEGPQVHLIGHSRGGAVSAFASWLLEQRGYSPAQLTTLDGYSTDWPDLSGILGDIDINAHAQADRRVNFLVQDGLAQYVGEAITSWISGFLPDWLDFGVDEYVQSSDFIDQFAAWKAPPRSNFDSNETIVGYQGADSQHLNINDLYFGSFRDLRSPRNYLADSPMGRQDQGRRGAEGEGGPSFDTEWAAASSIIDGSFEYLAAAISLEPEIRSAPQLVDNPFLRAYTAWTQLPGQDLSLAWQTVGDVQLVNQSSNPRVRLSAGGGLAEQALLSQVVALPAEAMLAMQVDVLSAPTGAILQVRINEEPVASLPLDGVANGRLKVDLAEFENQIVNVTILLQSQSDTTASLTIDDVRLVQPLVVESVTSEPLWLEDKSQVRLTASTATSCGTDCPEAVTFYRETNGTPGLQIGSDATLGTGSTTDSVTWGIPVDGAVFMPGIEQLYAVASSAEGATGPVNSHQLLVTSDAGPIWQNPINRFNVNADEQVSAIDALRVINFMARNPSGVLPNEQFDPPIYYDVNGDGTVTAIDALQVINFMARSSQSSADSEETVLHGISVTETKPSRGGKGEFYGQAEVLGQIAKLKVGDSSTRENSSAWSNRVDQALGWQSDDESDASSDFGVFSENDDLDRIVSEIVNPRLIARVSF